MKLNEILTFIVFVGSLSVALTFGIIHPSIIKGFLIFSLGWIMIGWFEESVYDLSAQTDENIDKLLRYVKNVILDRESILIGVAIFSILGIFQSSVILFMFPILSIIVTVLFYRKKFTERVAEDWELLDDIIPVNSMPNFLIVFGVMKIMFFGFVIDQILEKILPMISEK